MQMMVRPQIPNNIAEVLKLQVNKSLMQDYEDTRKGGIVMTQSSISVFIIMQNGITSVLVLEWVLEPWTLFVTGLFLCAKFHLVVSDPSWPSLEDNIFWTIWFVAQNMSGTELDPKVGGALTEEVISVERAAFCSPLEKGRSI